MKNTSVSDKIIERIKAADKRFFSCDSISEFITEEEKKELIDEVAVHFEQVMRSLLIDIDNDPNSNGTPRRLAKMYVNEIFGGRFNPQPEVTAFPNTDVDRYDELMVVRAEISSVCSHHWQNVTGVAYIGLLPTEEVIGLSKYIRLAKWEAQRGTLQEELTGRIARKISSEAKTPHVAVYIEAKHGCISCRGVGQQNSTTQTTVLLGSFKTDPALKQEFFDKIKLQKMES